MVPALLRLRAAAQGCGIKDAPGEEGGQLSPSALFSSFLNVLEQALWAKAQAILPGCSQGVNFFLGKGLPLLTPMESVRDSGALIRELNKDISSGGEVSQVFCYRVRI